MCKSWPESRTVPCFFSCESCQPIKGKWFIFFFISYELVVRQNERHPKAILLNDWFPDEKWVPIFPLLRVNNANIHFQFFQFSIFFSFQNDVLIKFYSIVAPLTLVSITQRVFFLSNFLLDLVVFLTSLSLLINS